MFDEKFAINKYPKKGKCKKSCFMNGYHRVGMFPIASIIDGAVPGCSVRGYCLECGKKFKDSSFIIKDQPSKLGEKHA